MPPAKRKDIIIPAGVISVILSGRQFTFYTSYNSGVPHAGFPANYAAEVCIAIQQLDSEDE
jgi:hypothetical protein